MKFYDREEEQELLENIRAVSLQESQMTVLFGRRRIGKPNWHCNVPQEV